MRFIGISEERKTVGQRHSLKRQSVRLFWNWGNIAFIIRRYCRNIYWRWFVKIKEETSVVGNRTSISWLHPLIHSHSHLIFSCCSTQDQLSLLYPLVPTARSFSSEALFHDYTVPSHIKYSAALLLPWALKKLPKVVSYPPVQIHLNDIFLIPTPFHRGPVEILSSARPYIMGPWPSIPKPIVERGERSISYPLPSERAQSPFWESKSSLSLDSLLSPKVFYLVAGGKKNWFNLTVLFPIFSLMPKPVYLFLKEFWFSVKCSARSLLPRSNECH